MSSIFEGSSYDNTALLGLLKEAQDALHALTTGSKAVSVTRNGRQVMFTPAKVQELRLYIQELQKATSVTTGLGHSPARIPF